MKIVILGGPDDRRGAVLAGARGEPADREALKRALADPEVGLIFVGAELATAAGSDDRIVVLPERRP